MKKVIKYFSVAVVVLMLNFAFVLDVYSDNPPPPPGNGETGNQVPGGGAPIGSGAIFLALLGVGYGAKKVYNYHKKKSTD